MAVNYTPTRGDYKDLTPFRFWCQKVLPMVYDDSLSYYELLCKVVDYLNKTMEDVGTLEEDVTNIYSAYESLQGYVNDYFDNLDVQDEIDDKLDRFVADGTIHDIFNDDVVAILNQGVQARDQAIANIPANVTSWLNDHIAQESGYVIDNTLSVQGAAADAKATGDAIDVVKKGLIKTLVATPLSIFETGSITANGGLNTNSSARIRTKTYIDPFVIGAVALSGYEFNVYLYLNDVYQGCLQSDGSIGKTSSVAYVSSYMFTNDYDYRLVLRKTNNTDITLDDYTNVNFLVNTDESLTIRYKSADAKAVGDKFALTNDKIASTNDKIINTILGTPKITVDNYSGIDWMEIGAINSSGADVERTDSYRSDFLPCYSDSTITSSMSLINAEGLSYYHYICFYDSNKTFISREGGSKDNTVIADVPTNATYYRVTLTYVTVGNVDSYTLTNELDNTNTFAPKTKWYVLGDSISAGYYSMTESMAEEAGVTMTYISPVTTEQGETTGSVWDDSLEHNYWGYANKWKLHQTIEGLAIPGQGYFHTAVYNSKNGVNVVNENNFSDAGLITVAWGFNDWHYNMIRGDHALIDASVPYPGENYDTSQITTVNHAIWYCLGTLIRKAPNAKIVVQTPMNGWAYGGDWNSNWGIGTAKSNSGTLADIHDDIVYWANYYGLQILDMTYNNSIVNRRNIKDTIIDGSHPSDAAHMQLGRYVAKALNYC